MHTRKKSSLEPHFCLSLYLFLFLFMQDLSAQNTYKYWNILTISGASGRFLYQIQPQLRYASQPVTFEELPLTLGAGYQFTKAFSMMLGQKTFYSSKRPNASSYKDYRWYQQGEYDIKETNKFLFFSILMAEEIQRSHQPGWFYRIRPRLGINQNLTKYITLIAYDEIFINLNKPNWVHTATFAQNRLFVGISQRITRKVALGLGYINQMIFDKNKQTGQIFALSLTFTPSKDKYGDDPIDEPVS